MVARVCAAACAFLLSGGSARAGDPWELWPEASAYLTLGSVTRAYLDASYARQDEAQFRTLDISAFLDISIKPVLHGRQIEDWQRSRYFWARIGFTRSLEIGNGAREVTENRAVVSAYGKLPMPEEIWLEGRARVDLRWIDGVYSTRYRLRLEATREFNVRGHPVVPFLNAEAFYDTRFDGWSRFLYEAGAEVTVDRHFRFELKLSRMTDVLPQHSAVNAVGLVAKWYY